LRRLCKLGVESRCVATRGFTGLRRSRGFSAEPPRAARWGLASASILFGCRCGEIRPKSYRGEHEWMARNRRRWCYYGCHLPPSERASETGEPSPVPSRVSHAHSQARPRGFSVRLCAFSCRVTIGSCRCNTRDVCEGCGSCCVRQLHFRRYATAMSLEIATITARIRS
jgi:hypothetical protein